MGTQPISKTKKYDCSADIYAAMAESTVYKDHLGNGRYRITDAHTYVKRLYDIDDFVRAVMSTTEPAFEIPDNISKEKRLNILKIGLQFFKRPKILSRKQLELEIQMYRLSPNINLYFESLPAVGHLFTSPYRQAPDGIPIAEHFNEFVENIRKNSKCKAYQDELKVRRKQAADNHKSLTKYIKMLFNDDHYARLAVVRLDLAYINDYKNLSSLDLAIAHREKFIGNRYHNKIFNKLVGYAWGVQYLAGKGGYYHHFFLFLDCESLPDNGWHKAIADYWYSITDGTGRCQNCDKGITDYDYPGAGIIKRSESEDFIERAASFLSKKELYFSLKYVNTQKKFRTFDKGKVQPKIHIYAGPTQD